MTHADRDGSERELSAYLAADKAEPAPEADRVSRYGKVIWTTSRNDEGTISATGANIVARAVIALADREQATLLAEIARWKDKAQEAGAAYANANTKHHAEWDRANRLERLADTLAGKAVDLEDRARAAERALADERAKVAQAWDDGYNDAVTMARCYGHTDHWPPDDEPGNPYRAALAGDA